MRRVFLDANVLFSAAYKVDARLVRLWGQGEVVLLTSGYAAEEARRNLDTPERQARLERLLAAVEIVPEAPGAPLPSGVRLPANDEPILRAAIASGATDLLTGDLRDFRSLFGKRYGGVLIQTPGDFLRKR